MIMRFKRIKKFRKIRIQPLCGEYLSWVPYLFFEEEDCAPFLCKILNWIWLGEFSKEKKMCM